MTTYSNESLQSLSKNHMIPVVLPLQSKFDQANKKMLEEILTLNNTFSTLESELSVTKAVNSLLLSRLVKMKHLCWANAQYSRRECLDIIGIPSEVEANVLEEKVVNIFENLGCNIPPNHIEACHRVSRGDNHCQVFFRRKGCQQVLAVKMDRRKIEMEDVDLPGQNKLVPIS